MTDSYALLARGLRKEFGSRRGGIVAVDGVDLIVEPGETFGLIGPDGAGKTTLTRTLLGLLRRTGGESRVLGYDSMREPHAIREHVGYIAQQFSLPPDLTVMENVRFFADIHGVRDRDQKRRIPELLAFAGLTEFTERLASRLSGGMKKKLALACSLVHEPQVVLLDEPTLGVDPVSRREFWTLLGQLRTEKGTTILVCTPYMDEAERCHRVGLMASGRLVAVDTPQGIKRHVPGRLLEFTPDPFRPALDALQGTEGVLEVQTYGRLVHAFVRDVDECRGRIEARLAEQGIVCSGMREIAPRMEEAFISIMRQQGERR